MLYTVRPGTAVVLTEHSKNKRNQYICNLLVFVWLRMKNFSCLNVCTCVPGAIWATHYSRASELLRSYLEAGACNGGQFISLLEYHMLCTTKSGNMGLFLLCNNAIPSPLARFVLVVSFYSFSLIGSSKVLLLPRDQGNQRKKAENPNTLDDGSYEEGERIVIFIRKPTPDGCAATPAKRYDTVQRLPSSSLVLWDKIHQY